MQSSTALRSKIMNEEGLSLHPYLDPPHNNIKQYSIGYGHQIQPNEQSLMAGITQPRAVQLFDADIARFDQAVSADLRKPVNQDQFDSLVDFAYNVGDGAVAKIIATWNTTGSVADTVARIKLYNQSGGHVNPDLVARRNYEAGLFSGLGHAVAAVAAEVKKN